MKKVLFFIVLTLLFGCKKNSFKINEQTFHIKRNVAYGAAPEQILDIYFHDKLQSNAGTFVLIHGGGWRGGDKRELKSFMMELMKKFPTYTFANINYSLAGYQNYALPTQTDEIDMALKFLEENSKQFNLNPEFVLLGNSAGGHLAALYTYKYRNNQVKSAVNIVGPVDLTDEQFKNYVDYEFVNRYLVNPSDLDSGVTKAQYASPVYWMKNSPIPLISFFGKTDEVIAPSQGTLMEKLLNSGRAKGKVYYFPGGHESWRSGTDQDFVIEKIQDFLKN